MSLQPIDREPHGGPASLTRLALSLPLDVAEPTLAPTDIRASRERPLAPFRRALTWLWRRLRPRRASLPGGLRISLEEAKPNAAELATVASSRALRRAQRFSPPSA